MRIVQRALQSASSQNQVLGSIEYLGLKSSDAKRLRIAHDKRLPGPFGLVRVHRGHIPASDMAVTPALALAAS